MRTSSLLRSIACTASILAATAAPGQEAAPPAEGDASAEELRWTPPPPSEPVQKLQREFSNLYASLRNNFGLQEDEVGIVRQFQQRVAQRLQSEPNSPQLLAMDLQLSMWLKDDERVDQSFAKLVSLSGDASRYGQAWLSYFRGRGDVDRLSTIYRTLLDIAPDDVDLRLSWGEQLKQEGRFEQALQMFGETEWSAEDDPTPAINLAEAQMGAHRFEDAVATLEAIPPAAFATKGSLEPRVNLFKRQAQDYQGWWVTEQELRSAEAEADDLPRVALETSRGRIVLELYEDQAPNTVANFVKLVRDGYYDGTVFHRRIPGSLIMGGDTPGEDGTADGTSNPGYRIPDEHGREDFRRHYTASIAMNKGGQKDSGGSIFYLTYKPLHERNGRYTVFGRVVEGHEALLNLRKDDAVMSATVVRTRDHEYEPQTIPLTTESTPAESGGITIPDTP